MNQGRTQRILGGTGLVAGGLISGLVVIVQFVIATNLRSVAELTTSVPVTQTIVGVFGVLGSVLFVAGFVLLAFARGAGGLFASALPTAAFVVLSIAFAVAQLFFRFAPAMLGAQAIELLIPLNRAINLILLAAIIFAAVAMAVSGRGVVARVVGFLPAVILFLLQFIIAMPYPEVLLPQAGFNIAWVIVGACYLAARPRVTQVTQPAENLAE